MEGSKILRVHVTGSGDGLSLLYQKRDGVLAFQKVYVNDDNWKLICLTESEESRILWITKMGLLGEKWTPSSIILNKRLLGDYATRVGGNIQDLPNRELIALKSEIEKEIEKRQEELNQASDLGFSSAG